jgi:outer membrane protein TolC
VIQGVETGARASAHVLAAQAAAFDQALLATSAASDAYAVVERLYREGLVDLLALLDAQTALRVSEELAADAAYDVVDASLDLQRAVGSFAALPVSVVTDPDALVD